MQALDICIDVSHAQGMIDWSRIAATGIRIAFIKASEGASFVDPRFERNRAQATAAGLVVVPYHFLRPDAARDQVRQFRSAAGLDTGTPVMLDWEGRASQTCSPSVTEAVGEELTSITGRPPIGYWGRRGSTPATPTDAMTQWPRNVPRYPTIGAQCWTEVSWISRDNPETVWGENGKTPVFAQYTKWGRLPGIVGPVDRDVAFFPSADDAVAWLGSGARAA